MKRNIFRIISVFIFVFFVITIFNTTVFAMDGDIKREEQIAKTKTIDDIMRESDNFIEKGKELDINTKGFSNTIYNILFAIGIVVDVVIGTIIGIKFMISTVEEKAKIKETLIIYFVGSIILFSAFGIWKIAISFVETI